jgi:hypothetical protein
MEPTLTLARRSGAPIWMVGIVADIVLAMR